MSEKSAELKLHEKIFKARKEAQSVGRKGTGTNGEEDFQFSRFEDVLSEGKRLLAKHRLTYTSSVAEETLHFGQKGCLAITVIEYTVMDLAGGGTLSIRWSGTGFDTPGGAALFMAQTGTEKYFLARLFQIPWGEDPETGSQSDPDGDTEADRRRAEQDRAADLADAPRHTKPLPASDHPPAEWEEPVSV